MWDVESGNVSFLRMRNDEWPCGVLEVPHRSQTITDAMRRAWGRKHMFYVRNEGIYILSLVDLRKKRNLHLR